MRPEERTTNYYNHLSRNETMNRVNLKKTVTSSYNKEVLRKSITLKIDPMKAAYDSELIWENEGLKKKVRKDEESTEFARNEQFQERLISSLNSLITR